MVRAAYTSMIRDRVLCLVDFADMAQTMSITNNAEAVVERAFKELEGEFDRIIYKDTTGRWDEIVFKDKKFSGFSYINEIDLNKALEKVNNVGISEKNDSQGTPS